MVEILFFSYKQRGIFMETMKNTCELTNAVHFEDAKAIVGEWLAHANTNQHMVVCATFDVDYLNTINEQYGWAAGNEVLRHLAAICHEASPFVTRHDDEMSVIWKDCSVEEGVVNATNLFKTLQQTIVQFEGIEIPVSVSMGITHNHAGDVTCFEELVSTATTAIHKSKNLGRNRFIMDVAPYL